MPFTLFCHQCSPEEALRFLRERGATVDGDEDDWNASFAMGGGFLKRWKHVKFAYDRQWCSPPNWPRQLAGMANFIGQFEMALATRRAVGLLIPRFEFSIGIVTEPDVTGGNDERLEIIQELATHLDCVIFTPGALCDGRLRVFAAADGRVDGDAKIPWGRQGEPSLPEEPELPHADGEEGDEAEEDEEFEPPTPERVARRLYALVAVVARGLYEMNANEGREPAYSLEELRHWAAELELDGELEPDERRILSTPAGELNGRDLIDSVWRVEGAVMLAWSLNLAPWPPHDMQVEVDDLLRALAFLDADRCRRVVAAPTLRDREILEKCSAQMLAYHWRMVDFRLRPEATEFEKVAIFGGPFDLSWAVLSQGDLSLQGTPISKAEQAIVGMCSSISVERFTAANWLVGRHPVYSETPTDT